MTEKELKGLLEEYSVLKKYVTGEHSKSTLNNTTKEIYDSKIREIESLMRLLEPSEEHIILCLHYTERLSVEKCAERMYMSRSSAYRSLRKAYRRLCEIINGEEGRW